MIIKGCRFVVKDIRAFPEDEIVLKGMAKSVELADMLPDKETEQESQHKIMDFVRDKNKKRN